jgi:hypothetical protein
MLTVSAVALGGLEERRAAQAGAALDEVYVERSGHAASGL